MHTDYSGPLLLTCGSLTAHGGQGYSPWCNREGGEGDDEDDDGDADANDSV